MGRPDSELYRGTRLEPHPGVAGPRHAGPERHRDRVPRRLGRAGRGRATRGRDAGRPRTQVTGDGCAVRWPESACFLALALVAGILAVRTADQAEQDRREQRGCGPARRGPAGRGAGSGGRRTSATGLLLAVEALTVDDSAQARDNLAARVDAGRLPGGRVRDLDGLPVSMSASPDGSLVAVSIAPGERSTGVHLFDSATLEPVEFAETAPASIIRFSPDGRQLAMAVNEWVDRRDRRGSTSSPSSSTTCPRGPSRRTSWAGWRPTSGVEYALEYSDDGRRLAAVVQHYDPDAGHWTGLGTATVWDLAQPARPVFGLTVPEYASRRAQPGRQPPLRCDEGEAFGARL